MLLYYDWYIRKIMSVLDLYENDITSNTTYDFSLKKKKKNRPNIHYN